MTEIYIIRHVQAEGNLYRYMQGHWDGDVTPTGRLQQEALSRRFRNIPVDAVYSSDLWRARFTAMAITGSHNVPVRCDRRLREICVGAWEGEPFANVIWSQPELYEAFCHDQQNFSLPGAETYDDVQKRALEALREIAENNPDRTVVITTHGVTIRCILAALLGVPLSDAETVPIFHNTGIAHLRYEAGKFSVDTINDASHLPPELLRRPSGTPALRHICVDPAAYRNIYEHCYADSWYTAHGNLQGFNAGTYFRFACEHYRRDQESIMLLYDGNTFAGLLDLDTARGAHAGYGWISLLYLCPEYRGRGIGTQLVGRAVVKYQREKRHAIRLHTSEDNGAALSFYRKNEFRDLSREPGAQVKLVLMEKKIRLFQ